MWELLITPVSSWAGLTALLCGALVLDLFWNYLIAGILLLLAPKAVKAAGTASGMDAALYALPAWQFHAATALIVVFEEMAFRLPLSLMPPGKPAITALCVSALAFGLIHVRRGSYLAPLLLQGVGGLVYGVVFLKAGGAHGHPLRGLACTLALHFAFNYATAVPGMVSRLLARRRRAESA